MHTHNPNMIITVQSLLKVWAWFATGYPDAHHSLDLSYRPPRIRIGGQAYSQTTELTASRPTQPIPKMAKTEPPSPKRNVRQKPNEARRVRRRHRREHQKPNKTGSVRLETEEEEVLSPSLSPSPPPSLSSPSSTRTATFGVAVWILLQSPSTPTEDSYPLIHSFIH